MVATSTGCESSVVGLKPMWAPQGVTVPHRCNGDARADAPQGTVGHIESDGGLVQQNGQAAVPRFFPRPRGTRDLPGIEAAEPWRVATAGGMGDICPAVRDTATGRKRRAETGLAANVGNDAPQPPHWTAARIGVEGTTQHRLRFRASWCSGQRIAHHN